MTEKEGSFDWIVSFESLVDFFSFESIGISESERQHKNVLIIGCGTSNLSEKLVTILKFEHVTSIDNDIGCIEHMKQVYSHESKRLQWFAYDILSGEGKHQSEKFQVDGYFDLIVDKGTLDAILVEGQVSSMLQEVYRLLNRNGVYMVCSLFSIDVMYPLLSTSSLGYEVKAFETPTEINELGYEKMSGNVLLCRKKFEQDFKIDLNQLRQEEDAIMDSYFKSQTPLLTIERENEIRTLFNNPLYQASMENQLEIDEEYLSLQQAYSVLFTANLSSLGYTWELFMEDIQDFPLLRDGKMNADEAIEFIRTKQ